MYDRRVAKIFDGLASNLARKARGGRSFPGPSAYCVVHCWLILQSELGVANFQLPRQLLSVCRRLRCDLGLKPPPTQRTAGRVRTPEHPHATINGTCSRDAPGPTDQLSPASSAHRGGGRAAPSPLLRASSWLRRRARDGASAAGLANASQAWRVRARTMRHNRTCPPCLGFRV